MVFKIWIWRPAPLPLLEVNKFDPFSMFLSHAPTMFPESGFSGAHLTLRPPESVSTSLWFSHLIFFLTAFLPPLSPLFTHFLPFAKSYSPCRPWFCIWCLTLHLSCKIHCMPLRMNADKEANVDEMMLRMYFRIEGSVREVGVVHWDLEG